MVYIFNDNAVTERVTEEVRDLFYGQEDVDIEVDVVTYAVIKSPYMSNHGYQVVFDIDVEINGDTKRFTYKYGFSNAKIYDNLMYPENDKEMQDTLIHCLINATDHFNNLFIDVEGFAHEKENA